MKAIEILKRVAARENTTVSETIRKLLGMGIFLDREVQKGDAVILEDFEGYLKKVSF